MLFGAYSNEERTVTQNSCGQMVDKEKHYDSLFFLYVSASGKAWRTTEQLQPAGTLRFVCISDTHTREPEIRLPPGDVLIHAGDGLYRDANKHGVQGDLAHLNTWMAKQPHRERLFVAGNHEECAFTPHH